MSDAAKRKAAIDCTGYRSEMDSAVDLIIADLIDDDDVESFIEMQRLQEALWVDWRDKVLGPSIPRRPRDDD